MKKSKGAKAIEAVAKKHGVSAAEIRKEIEIAIEDAMSNPKPAARAFWEPFIKSGKKPAPEEFLIAMAKKAGSDH